MNGLTIPDNPLRVIAVNEPLITCRELSDFIGDYLAGGLTPKQHAAFDRHMAVCPECRDYLESYKMTVAMGKSAFDNLNDPPPPSLPPGIIKAILELHSKV